MNVAPAALAPDLGELLALREVVLRHAVTRGRGGSGGPPGAHRSPQRGRGLDYAESRPYQAGDDVRQMDWRQTARRRQPYVKCFHEERQRPLRLLVDLGPSMQFGTRRTFKSVAAARAAALLAWQAAATGDRIAGLVWRGAAFAETPARAREPGVIALLHLLAAPAPADPPAAADFAAGLEALARRLAPTDRVAIFSDFMHLDEAGEAQILRIGRRANCRLLVVADPFELAPPPGRYVASDGRQEIVLDLRGEPARRAYAARCQDRLGRLRHLALRAGATVMALSTAQALPETLGAVAWP